MELVLPTNLNDCSSSVYLGPRLFSIYMAFRTESLQLSDANSYLVLEALLLSLNFPHRERKSPVIGGTCFTGSF